MLLDTFAKQLAEARCSWHRDAAWAAPAAAVLLPRRSLSYLCESCTAYVMGFLGTWGEGARPGALPTTGLLPLLLALPPPAATVLISHGLAAPLPALLALLGPLLLLLLEPADLLLSPALLLALLWLAGTGDAALEPPPPPLLAVPAA
jgi:hypothetical protein